MFSVHNEPCDHPEGLGPLTQHAEIRNGLSHEFSGYPAGGLDPDEGGVRELPPGLVASGALAQGLRVAFDV